MGCLLGPRQTARQWLQTLQSRAKSLTPFPALPETIPMPTYKAPLDDYRFVLFDLLQTDRLRDLAPYANMDRETVDAVLEGAADICETSCSP